MRQRGFLFEQFSQWGYNTRGWGAVTGKKYLNRCLAAESWLVQHRRTSLVCATPKDLEAHLFSTARSARNRNNIRQALVGFGAFCLDLGYTESNRASGLPRLPEPQPLPKALTQRQASRVWKAAQAHSAQAEALVALMLYGGLRKTETRTLERRHVRDNQFLLFTGKGAKDRMVPLHPHAQAALARWERLNLDARWIFPSPKAHLAGKPLSDTHFRIVIKEVGDMAGVEMLHPHALRHTFATSLSDAGRRLEEIQDLLGHSSPRTTRIYTKVAPSRLTDAIGSLDFTAEYIKGSGASPPSNGLQAIP